MHQHSSDHKGKGDSNIDNKMAFVLPSTRFIVFTFSAAVLILFVPQFFMKKLYSADGGYAEWSQWSACLKDCGDSMQGRYRNCTNPRPSGFGVDCMAIGSHIESRPCKVKDCPIHGHFSPWTDWTECDKPCKDGNRKRSRKCDDPAPSKGGSDCSGPKEETQPCLHLKPCPVDGGFSNWGEFEACSVSCGTGHKVRKRECNNPAPAFGGKNCDGSLQEVVDCKEKDCEKPA